MAEIPASPALISPLGAAMRAEPVAAIPLPEMADVAVAIRTVCKLPLILDAGGGWGDPLERDPAMILKDVRNEFLSAAKAEADYGVVIDTATWTIDAAATKKKQAEIRNARAWKETPKVQWHDPIPAAKAAAKAAE